MISRTIVIWNEVGDELRFFVVDKDLSEFQDIYINIDYEDEQLTDKLNSLVYNEDGEYKVKMLRRFPLEAIIPNETAVITCGLIP